MQYSSLEIRLRMNLKSALIMKIEKRSKTAAAVVLLSVLLAAGCGKKDDAPNSAAPVRSEPIRPAEVRGEPIQAPAAKADSAVSVRGELIQAAEVRVEPIQSPAAKTEVEAVAKNVVSALASGPAASETMKAAPTADTGEIATAAKPEPKKAVVAAELETARTGADETSAPLAEAVAKAIERKKPPRFESVDDAASVIATEKARTIQTAAAEAGNAAKAMTGEAAAAASKAVETVATKSTAAIVAPAAASPKPDQPVAAVKTSVAETVVTVPAEAASTLIPNPALEKEPEVVKSGGQDYLTISFERLASFEYEMPDEFTEVADAGDGEAEKAEETKAKEKPEEKDQIPATVRKFNNKRIALEGFMLPLKVEDSLVTEMLIMRDQSMCCFGSVPKINEWVSIRMTGKGVKPVMDEPVTIYGKLKVGEIRENGYLVGIYEMDGERMGSRIDL